MLHDLSLAVLAVAVAIIALRVHRLGRASAPSGQQMGGKQPAAPLAGCAATQQIAASVPAPAGGAAQPAASGPPGTGWDSIVTQLGHKLRMPLNTMIASAETLLESRLQPGQRQQAELIAENGRAVLRLLADVLDMARLDAGAMPVDLRGADLRTTLDHCAAVMRPIAEARGLALTVNVEDNVPEQVTIDVQLLRHVLLNLIGNAVKFTENGSVTVEARLCPLDDGRAALGLAVIDTGPGIAADRQVAIFQPFAGSGEEIDANRGTGLGLAITRRLLAAMGGDITVQSTVGLGSRFTVRLPLGQSAPPMPGPSCPQAGLRGRRVLLAEDHEINQELLLAMLDKLGVVTTLVSNGREAVDAVAEAARLGLAFDLVLMDVRMPGVDGLEATARLRAAGHDAVRLPVVALTASCRAEDIAACRAAGMQAHLTKPVRIDDLGRTLRDVLAGNGQAAICGPAAGQDLQSATAASAAGMQRLDHRYRQRKGLLFGQIRATISAAPESSCEEDWSDIAAQLHKLAGVAANFGEEELGELARRLEHDLRTERRASARHLLLSSTWPALAEFA